MTSIHSRLHHALFLSTADERKGIVEQIKDALRLHTQRIAVIHDTEVRGLGPMPVQVVGDSNMVAAPQMPGVTIRPPRSRIRSIRNGTQHRYHRRRGLYHLPAMNHHLSNDKFNQYMHNGLLQRMLGQAGVYTGVAQ